MIFNHLIPYITTIKPTRIHCYLSTPSEVQTDEIIGYALHHDISVFSWLPSSPKEYNQTQINTETTWYTRQNGVPIPNSPPIVDSPPLDLIIVPLLGFDEHCNRLGHGQGTYDTFLPHHPEAITFGLAFETQLVPLITCEPHDISLDYIITERHTYTNT